MPTGARAILIQWDFNREWRDISGRGFTITIVPPSGTGNTVTVQLDEHARSHLEGGLVPFSYNSPSGIVYEVFIEARNSFGLSDRVSATVTIPRELDAAGCKQMIGYWVSIWCFSFYLLLGGLRLIAADIKWTKDPIF